MDMTCFLRLGEHDVAKRLKEKTHVFRFVFGSLVGLGVFNVWNSYQKQYVYIHNIYYQRKFS